MEANLGETEAWRPTRSSLESLDSSYLEIPIRNQWQPEGYFLPFSSGC
ncbi:MAG: hypothetical protein J6D08_07405 [Lachnospiraceae bacterium]|nr:hypothetical protein [Lachnospiraceae bacterium]